jgi:hypothetical protein
LSFHQPIPTAQIAIQDTAALTKKGSKAMAEAPCCTIEGTTITTLRARMDQDPDAMFLKSMKL